MGIVWNICQLTFPEIVAGPHAASESSILFSAASQKSSAELCWFSAVSQS
jgi:hypothetical protein